MEMEDKKKNPGVLVCPNPIATADTSSLSASQSSLMPPAIHGAVGESMKKESTIDYPASSTLCPDVWDRRSEGEYVIKEDIKQKALELVDKLLAKYKVEAKGVNVVGSICSNQYTDDADVDIHI